MIDLYFSCRSYSRFFLVWSLTVFLKAIHYPDWLVTAIPVRLSVQRFDSYPPLFNRFQASLLWAPQPPVWYALFELGLGVSFFSLVMGASFLGRSFHNRCFDGNLCLRHQSIPTGLDVTFPPNSWPALVGI